ncbi:MAG: hypothetical protein NT080_02010 [Spirochaetes bacterium]|nr:hypothetical protein [Spirochaetota bacterium]
MSKNVVIMLVVILWAAAAMYAQSNEAIDRILAADAVDYGKVAYLVLVASDNIAEDAGESRSFEMLKELKWVDPGVAETDPVSLSEYAYFLMKAFGLRGGLMYSLVPGKRYAYRELVSRKVIQGRADPADRVTGDRAIRVLGRILDLVGD